MGQFAFETCVEELYDPGRPRMTMSRTSRKRTPARRQLSVSKPRIMSTDQDVRRWESSPYFGMRCTNLPLRQLSMCDEYYETRGHVHVVSESLVAT
jgi:hypothetical protein